MKTIAALLALILAGPAVAEEAWKCPDGSVAVGRVKPCLGGQRKSVDDMNAAELNAYVRASREADEKDAQSKKREELQRKADEFRHQVAEDRKAMVACQEAFAGRPEVKNSGFDGSVPGVERYLKRSLKDPDSYQSVEWSRVVPGCGNYLVRHKYRARSSFGGYVLTNQLFTLDADGVVTGAAEVR